MGYFIASCVVTWSVLCFYALVLIARSRRSRRFTKGEVADRR